MTAATFRFYARLNDFLPAKLRGHTVACVCADNATIKHMIEVLGVPHTEIALVLANGEAAELGQQIEEGVRIAVYPKFESLDISTVTRIPQRAAGVPRFVADAHLGRLARLLRMAGFDTLYDNFMEDAAIAALARQGQRIVLTRDRDLLKHRAVEHGCYVHAVKPHAQLHELFDRLDLYEHIQLFSLCLKCNSPLRPAPMKQVLERLPARIRERHDRFLWCDTCDNVYWEGTHWQNMRHMLESLSASVLGNESGSG